MTFKQAFVLSISILLLIAAAGCGGSSTHEPQVEAAAAEEVTAAPLEFSEAPEGAPIEATGQSSPAEALQAPRSDANEAPAPPRGQQPSSPAPQKSASAEQATQPDYRASSSPAPADAGDTSVADKQQDVVVPPAAPRTAADAPSYRDSTPPPPPQPRYVSIPEGTVLEIRLEERVASDEQKTGDLFKARLDRDIEVDGKIIFAAGTEVSGKVLEASKSGRVEGRARMELALETLRRGEESFSVRTNPIAIEAEGSKGRDAKIIGGAAAVGALIGAITGGKKGAAVGAAGGAGAGTAGVLITKGDEVDLPKERLLSFRLEDSFEVEVK